jgi:hypothetical protein
MFKNVYFINVLYLITVQHTLRSMTNIKLISFNYSASEDGLKRSQRIRPYI